MSSRSWRETKEIDGKTYILQYTSVDSHEGATHSSFILFFLESEQELKEFKSKYSQGRNLDQE